MEIALKDIYQDSANVFDKGQQSFQICSILCLRKNPMYCPMSLHATVNSNEIKGVSKNKEREIVNSGHLKVALNSCENYKPSARAEHVVNRIYNILVNIDSA
ncbi:hypothetical protein V8B55DRAFT_1586247 [Mucor lusitanicus]|uniref:Uncharacterized protein n=1 Tax=Mucor lusitanicus CBS 277.49 TaxID=747725 RepID=A0A162NQP4_MUCCL|nr:hypothetical protein MUCCIDRAFT_80205 [Mucor lusitanicus CBS 277.49]